MKFTLLILFIFLFAMVDFSDKTIEKSPKKIVPDSLVSIIDFGASPSNPNNSDAFRDAFEVADHIFVPAAETPYLVAGNLMIKKGKSLTFEKGAVLDVEGLFNGYDTKIIAGNYQIFTPRSELSGSFLADTLFADWMGAKGDGKTDDFLAIKKFFDLTDLFQFKYMKLGKNKIYFLSSGIERKVSKTFHLDGNGSTLIRDYKDITETNNQVLRFSGISRDKKMINQDLEAGSDLMILDNTIGIEAGMGLIIYSKELYGIEFLGNVTVRQHHKGLISTVVKVLDGFTIQIADKIPYHFDAKQIKSVDFYDVIPLTVKNLNFSLLNASNDTIKAYELYLKNLFNVKVIGCKFIPNGYSAITASGLYNSLIKNIYIQASENGNSNYLGVYGIVPSLNVNVVYDSIYARATTHGIAFTKWPSFGVKVINSNLKAMIEEANGFDSHSSFEIYIENSEIWGAQGNFGSFKFVHCKMHNSAGASHIWKDRHSSVVGKLKVIIRDCEIIFSNKEATNIFYPQAPRDSSNSYQLINCKVALSSNPDAYTDILRFARTINSEAKIQPLIIEGCTFSGKAKLFFPRDLKDSPIYKQRGTFVFKNNKYNNLQILKPNDAMFENWVIEGNKPLNKESNFKISIFETDANYQIIKNELLGEEFVIKNNKGSFEFKNNMILNGNNSGKPNVFTDNQHSVFEKNEYPQGVQVLISGTIPK